MADNGADLTGFLEAAGRSLADAQVTLSGELIDIPPAVAISEAELEVKATLDPTAGRVSVQPVTSRDARERSIAPELLSTIRIRYVAVAEDTGGTGTDRPTRTAEEAIEQVRRRDDVAVLDEILGGLSYDAVFVAAPKRWLITATDPQDRVVREVIVPDVKR